jgi:hypothetical protein
MINASQVPVSINQFQSSMMKTPFAIIFVADILALITVFIVTRNNPDMPMGFWIAFIGIMVAVNIMMVVRRAKEKK